MKKQVIVALALSISAFSFAQKKELKAAEKAIKSNNYAEAKAALNQVTPTLSSIDDKYKSKYYFLQAEALYANGAGSAEDVNKAIESLSMVDDSMKGEVAELTSVMQNSFLTKANESFTSGNYKAASTEFEQLYNMVPADTTYLYYSAVSAVQDKDYDTALKHYITLDELGYTGITTEYFATNIETGKEEVMSKENRDLFVKAKSHNKPGQRVTESKQAEITKNIALIYVSQDKSEEALAAIKKARQQDPENIDLILSEANLYLKLEDTEKFSALMEEAIKQQPDNPNLHYNIGVIALKNKDFEQARASFQKALVLKPDYADAALNESTTYIDEGNELIEEMNSLGTSAKDNARYDELRAKKTSLFDQGADALIKYIEKNPNPEPNIYQQLINIYNATGETAKSKEIQAKLDAAK
ncbi:tetratricopeptide repeat family protein [Formosa agariphila KMM 3901]|uniref:Tetratricopeptide repeat family protein n=1 Tax=Formosa agariphila (strain DSM 15362 / KCTC 12365 / LMG 23005 / KMM 3901 / M-2Alg 35-1) TaxID=1347342 RepID=T2KNK7_FORAG|nr:tetratricopeptide repeat protein [Formosa agariphila]CDF80053.1 tetratricopeptide repeat family protein [Formosa agariphila KMM 3901]